MKAAEASDRLRSATGSNLSTPKCAENLPPKCADNLPCNARAMSLDSLDGLSDKRTVAGESFGCPARTAPLCKLPNPPADNSKDQGARSQISALHPPDLDPRNHVLKNLLQTGGMKCKLASLPSVASMERRRRRRYCTCSDQQLSSHSSSSDLLHCTGKKDHLLANYNGSSCNCNMENFARIPNSHPCPDDGLSSSFKSQSWRSASDQSTTNAALHRALAAMKKVSGEPDAVKKSYLKARGAPDRGTLGALPVPCDMDRNGSSITNSDARTLSMRERGRWGNSKMQQQLFSGSVAPAASSAAVKPSLGNSDHHHHHQALQHVQCLHCGSFSTTPVASAARGTRSSSFGRRVRDYSWQQELQQEHKRPEQQAKEENGGHSLPQSGRSGGQINSYGHLHQCEYAHCADEFPEFEADIAETKLQYMQGAPMSWQERYMLLCQAIAVGAFVDGAADDNFSGPMVPPSRGYSRAVCECTACDQMQGNDSGSFRQGMATGNYYSTSSGERMMELEAFSGPIGYVSESKGTEISGFMEKRAARRGVSRWWARLPSFGKAKSSYSAHQQGSGGGLVAKTAAGAAGQNTAQCSSCGQRVWATGNEEAGGKLCPDCMGRGGGGGGGGDGGGREASGANVPLPAAARPAPPSAGRARQYHGPPFSQFAAHHHQKGWPRRWRLMKLCRYLMGVPLQR